jgi:hypothetical protein
MTELTTTSFLVIERWLEPWLSQLRAISAPYRVLVDELDEPELHQKNLTILETHIGLAAESCSAFEDLLYEKRQLPDDIDEANRMVLDKLAEVRAVVGLSWLGFSDIAAMRAPGPDLSAIRDGKRYVIEVTRLGSSVGKRSQVWDAYHVLEGSTVGTLSRGGKAQHAISEAVYREIEDKSRQLKLHRSDAAMIWISLGRDYLTAGRYELPGVGGLRNLKGTLSDSVFSAAENVLSADISRHVSSVVLSPGSDLRDIEIAIRE